MKKLLLILLLLCSIKAGAQTYYYRTTEFACKQTYGSWSDWEDSNLLVIINFDKDIVKIKSATEQVYRITEYVRNYTDASGGQQIVFNFIDQDYDRGIMRLRIEQNGNSQIYIEFSNVMWVYNVIRVSRYY